MGENEREHSRFALIFAGGTLFSRVLGLVRDFVWVLVIPVASRDAFIVAFRFPNMLRDLVGEGASNAAIVPVLSESLEKDSKEEFQVLVSSAMSTMLIILAVVTALGIAVIPFLLGGLDLLRPFTHAEAVSSERIDLMVRLSVWTFPYILFIGMAVFCMGPLFALKHYSTPSWSPALLNVSIIGCCLLFYRSFEEPAYALVLGVWLGGIAQLVAQYIALGKLSGVWWPNFKLRHPGVRTILWLLVPVLLGQSAGELNKLVDTLFAASLPLGTVTALFYANRLVQLPLSVFGIATSVAILPSISRAAARGDHDEIRRTLMYGLRQSFFLVFPAMLGLIVLGRPIVHLLFEYGHFGPDDTTRTATALVFYGAGLLSFAWVKISVTGFFAVKDTKTPVIIASISMLTNIALNCALVGPMGYRGLALATTIAFTMKFLLLYLFLCRRFGNLWDTKFVMALVRMGTSAVAMAVVAYTAYGFLDRQIAQDDPLSRLLIAGVPIIMAAGTYAVACKILRVSELGDFALALRRRRG